MTFSVIWQEKYTINYRLQEIQIPEMILWSLSWTWLSLLERHQVQEFRVVSHTVQNILTQCKCNIFLNNYIKERLKNSFVNTKPSEKMKETFTFLLSLLFEPYLIWTLLWLVYMNTVAECSLLNYGQTDYGQIDCGLQNYIIKPLKRGAIWCIFL